MTTWDIAYFCPGSFEEYPVDGPLRDLVECKHCYKLLVIYRETRVFCVPAENHMADFSFEALVKRTARLAK